MVPEVLDFKRKLEKGFKKNLRNLRKFERSLRLHSRGVFSDSGRDTSQLRNFEDLTMEEKDVMGVDNAKRNFLLFLFYLSFFECSNGNIINMFV
ncbi:uncharacterized protein OCT59_026467 [Rhizophagus irregularis]|uniref:uncharacterized protein n=1 Tax=Rhizophagus irregularis TaxID=588596 RepID=UPI00332DAE47|nr:hypothetical protein OCT59_026467 [Rhizophagus irregularis]